MSGILSTTATSRRGYLSQAELAQFADITISDVVEANDRISQAEEIIDGYVGYQDQFFSLSFSDVWGLAAGVTTNTIQLESRHQSVFQDNFFQWCEVEIVGGTGAGQRQKVSTSTYAGLITTVDAFSPALDTTSMYRLYQLGKFPRRSDVFLDAIHFSPPMYFKSIPEKIKRATAAQVQYMIEQGDAFFQSDDIFKNAEKIGDYSYEKARDGSGTGIGLLIAPKARQFLVGVINRRGQILV